MDNQFEIFHKDVIRRKFSCQKEYYCTYYKHMGWGSSGEYNDKTKIGIIRSHLTKIKFFEKRGYTNLNFNNGGDDDVLVVDHINKQFGFFEDYAPAQTQMDKCKTLIELRKNT